MLDVYFQNSLIGHLEQDKNGEMKFTYAASWLADPNAISISCSLPLREKTFSKNECKPFFDGLLPEDTQRKIIAKVLGISANNDFSMLEKLGGECAGALTFINSGEKYNIKAYQYQEVPHSKLPDLFNELTKRPLLAGDKGVRLSLAGVQDKIALYIEADRIFIPLNNAPSTHILKPDFTLYEGVVYNEAFCMNLAKKIGLKVAEVQAKKAAEIDYLQIKRYDRSYSSSEQNIKHIVRVHQEDFCQALAIPSANKYQNEGGPSLEQCVSLLREKSSIPVINLNMLVNAVIYNFLIGNCDAHGKNYSLLYLDGIQLSPLYDLISTVYYPELDKKMAMKLGGEYKINNIKPEHFDIFAAQAGLAKPEVRKRIREIIDSILASLPEIETLNQIQDEVSKLIRTRCETFAKQLLNK